LIMLRDPSMLIKCSASFTNLTGSAHKQDTRLAYGHVGHFDTNATAMDINSNDDMI
jgi:hypothetical protein